MHEGSTTLARSLVQATLRWARRLFLPLALAFFAFAAWASRDVVAEVVVRAEVRLLLAAVATWCSLHLLTPLTTRLALAALGVPIDYRTALHIHIRRLPARYLPGGIWQTVSRVADLRAMGVGKSQLAALVALENAAPLAVAMLLAGAWLAIAGATAVPAPALLAAGGGLALCLPWLMHRALPGIGRIRLRHYLGVLGSCAVFWMVAAGAFACYWSAFPDARAEADLPSLLGTYLLAWSAGFAAIFAPQGIGVFESVAALMLDGRLSFALVAVMVAGFRAATLTGDLLAYLMAKGAFGVWSRTPSN
ncbi:hypothetical protein GCM10011521_24430 [Arenimonas soli]|uniref:Flippase-like domain-containing protein n=1 Tax=Arenimonas soli TaxID=2269504 RepID=A0ABQ1HQZ0_9GAMM|nr:hypothetical protein GCM10011521_24430 [Arenimonas soli]